MTGAVGRAGAAKGGVRGAVRRSYARWLARRIPAARSVTLDQRRVFIFLSRPGWLFVGVLLVMLLAAINYQNNMAFLLVFLLFSLMAVAVLHTYANLAGLTLTALRAAPTYAGEQAVFDIQIARRGDRDHFDLHLRWPGQTACRVAVLDSTQQGVRLFHQAAHRGVLRPGRLLIETFYPLGLLRAWSWLALDMEALVYPRPLPASRHPQAAHRRRDEQGRELADGLDDFSGFRVFRTGDSLRHVYWRGYARGAALHSKQFVDYAEQREWLDWEDFPGADSERRLSHLCHWVLRFESERVAYGLRLPGVDIPPGLGPEHRDRALEALARFGSPP